jgi:hypothetical protein
MTAVNATGLRAMEGFADAVDASGRMLLVCGAPPQPARLMARVNFIGTLTRRISFRMSNLYSLAHRTPACDSLTAKSGQLFALIGHEEPGRAHG